MKENQSPSNIDLSPYYDIIVSSMEKSYKRAKPFMKAPDKPTGGKRLRIGVAAGVISATFLFGTTALASQSICVTEVLYGEEIQKVVSFSAEPQQIVEKAGYSIQKDDTLLLDYFKGEGDNNLILVLNPYPIKIYRDGKLLTELTASGTVEDVLLKAGITLKDGDSLNMRLNTAITEETKLEIYSGFPVIIKVDGKKIKTGFPGGTVKEALAKAEIEYDGDDEISPKLTQKLKKKTTITVKRVELKEITRTQETDFPTEIQYDANMYEDESKVGTKGKKGTEKLYYLVKYVDGKKTESVKFKTETVKKATPKVIIKGTKKRPRNYVYGTRVFSELTPPFEIELDESNRPVKYKKIITGKATAYCGGGITATGQKAMPGRIAVNPKQIPYGTKMYIVSSDGKYVYGYCVASDTGGFVKKRSAIADLYMHSYNDCMQFGRRNVDIYILE